MLPLKKSEPSNNIYDYAFLVHGPQKIGKTTFFAQFPDALHVFFEPGGKSLRLYRVLIKQWRDFRLLLKELESSDRFKMVIIDTVEMAMTMCEEYTCRKLGVEHPSEAEYGKAWSAMKNEFKRSITSIQQGGRGVGFISHSMIKEIEGTTGRKRDVVMPSVGKQAREILDAIVDCVVYYDYVDEERVLRIKGSDTIVAGSRIEGHFVGCDLIKAGMSAKETYKNFLLAFNSREDSKKFRLKS